jgi:hypothetical protein
VSDQSGLTAVMTRINSLRSPRSHRRKKKADIRRAFQNLDTTLAALYPLRYSEQVVVERRGRFVKFELKTLTTCGVKSDVEIIELNFVDSAGAPVCIQMPLGHAQSIAMMILGLLTDAVRKNVGTDKSRYAFLLGNWCLDPADESDCLIATFATKNGFEVSFAIPRDVCGRLSQALRHKAGSQPDGVDLSMNAHHDDIRFN